VILNSVFIFTKLKYAKNRKETETAQIEHFLAFQIYLTFNLYLLNKESKVDYSIKKISVNNEFCNFQYMQSVCR